MDQPDVRKSLRGLDRWYRRIEPWLESPPEDLTEAVPEVSLWSPAHHLFHVALSNELGMRNVTSLLGQRGRLIKDFESISDLALDVIRTGRHPRGTQQAPRMVTPPPRVDLEVMIDILRSNLDALGKIRERVDEVADAPRRIPHQVLGDLSAAQWMRFLHAHSMHHWLIIVDIEAARSSA